MIVKTNRFTATALPRVVGGEVRGAAGVEAGQQEAAEEGDEGEGGGGEERPAQGGRGVEAGGEAAVQPLHHQEVDGGAQPALELQTKVE